MNLCKVAIVLISGVIVSCGDGKASQRSERGCTLVVAVAPDDTPTLQGDCPRDGKHAAAAISRAANSLKAGDELALGRTPFGPDGVFNHCGIAARLAADPHWAASIDSRQAVAPLRDALQSVSLAPAVTDALAKAGRNLRGVSLETVLLSDGPARGCATSPIKVPEEAQLWLSLE